MRPIGGLALIGTGMTKSTATALTSLSAIALERARILQKELRAQADRQTEQLAGIRSRRSGASVQDSADGGADRQRGSARARWFVGSCKPNALPSLTSRQKAGRSGFAAAEIRRSREHGIQAAAEVASFVGAGARRYPETRTRRPTGSEFACSLRTARLLSWPTTN